ncbi:hypothetical protein BJ166DRAFT_534465 [Pestalotiopsis sp. NC0098]|nr:hypothetical protein BJ166DRAFT_534465 [Pestalotiopsis sp. NC0098]
MSTHGFELVYGTIFVWCILLLDASSHVCESGVAALPRQDILTSPATNNKGKSDWRSGSVLGLGINELLIPRGPGFEPPIGPHFF